MLGLCVSAMQAPHFSHTYSALSKSRFAHRSDCSASQCGQGTRYRRRSPPLKAVSIRDTPFTVGVEKRPSFLFQKLSVRFFASDTGSPSSPAEGGKRSTSSSRTTRIGRDARPAAEL